MFILAVETTCDDTSLAIFEDEKLLTMSTKSQIKVHQKTGGVVPEVAAREHANAIFEVFHEVLQKMNMQPEDFDYIAVSVKPWLLPSILTGTIFASTISTVCRIPIIPIDHIEAHIFANFLEREEKEIDYPCACLTVSGGHNEVYYMPSMFEKIKLGATTDDSAWEAFDKTAKMMGLGYPGGPIISKLAAQYEAKNKKGIFPRVRLKKDEFEFSFSGLKSSVKREIDARGELTYEDKIQISYEFENAVTEVLAYKGINAAKKKNCSTILLAGGVSANTKLRDTMQKYADVEGLKFIFPKKIQYCMDNAAMVGINAYYKVKNGEFEEYIGTVSP